MTVQKDLQLAGGCHKRLVEIKYAVSVFLEEARSCQCILVTDIQELARLFMISKTQDSAQTILTFNELFKHRGL